MTPDGEHLGPHQGERPVERRLRQALSARADGVDARRLRTASPPGARAGRRPAERLRRFAVPLAALTAAAAAVAGVGYLLFVPDAEPGPQLPATPPRLTTPGPSSGGPPSPSPSRPGRPSGGDASAAPSGVPTPDRSLGPTVRASPGPSGAVPPSRGASPAPGAAATSSPPVPRR
ncbi:hypothetical protein [Streptomyces sp. NPDC058874]|uniref:hypothetical protein n=1 Tax=unclassified Streptomyces TaxID=2593676 RepID=UPI0036929C8B